MFLTGPFAVVPAIPFITVLVCAVIFCMPYMLTRIPMYIDVSATTYIIQIIAGIAVTAGVIAGVVITKIKKKAKEKLNIDFDKKEVEEDIVVFDEEKTEE